MPQASAFDQAVKILCEVRGVVAGTFQSLCHEQHLEMGRVALCHCCRQMFLEQSVADAVDLLVHLQYLPGTFEIERGETPVDQVKHVTQHSRHFHKLTHIRGRHL